MTQHVLLWSKQQNALHIEPIERTLSLNRESYRDNEAVLYAPIAVGTHEEMLATAASIRGTLEVRERAQTKRKTGEPA